MSYDYWLEIPAHGRSGLQKSQHVPLDVARSLFKFRMIVKQRSRAKPCKQEHITSSTRFSVAVGNQLEHVQCT